MIAPAPRPGSPDFDRAYAHLTEDERDELERLAEAEAAAEAESQPPMSLEEFQADAWHVVEPADAELSNWHISAICEHLEALTFGQLRHLVVNMPPRFMKSLLISVFWFCWVWTFRPSWRWLFASYAQSLSTRDSLKCRRVIQSNWYQERWGDRFQLAGDQNAKMRFENTRTGFRIATSVDGMGTGEGGHVVVADDPHNAREALSDANRESVLSWWDIVMSTRLNSQRVGHRVVVMQRLHERDLSGHIIEKYGLANGGGASDWTLLMLPNEYEPRARVAVTPLGWTDPRTTEKELLWPARMDRKETESQKITLGSYGYAGQYQQRPAPAEGGIFKVWWWQYWQLDGEDLGPVSIDRPDQPPLLIYPVTLPRLELLVQSWDMAFKDTDGSDFVVGQAWGQTGPNAYLIDEDRAQRDFPDTIRAVLAFTDKHRQATAKWVEDKANGPAVIAVLRKKIPGLIAVEPDGDKVARARAAAPFVESGNVFVPHPRRPGCSWVNDWIAEHTVFDNGAYDDRVDAETQAVRRLLAGPDTTFARESHSEFSFS